MIDTLGSNWRLEEAHRAYPDIAFESITSSYNWNSNIPPLIRYSSRYDPTITPARIRVLLPAGMVYVSYLGKNVVREKQFGNVDWSFPIPGWPGNRRPRLEFRNGRITGSADSVAIALIDEWLDPVLVNYDLREITRFLTELNLRAS